MGRHRPLGIRIVCVYFAQYVLCVVFVFVCWVGGPSPRGVGCSPLPRLCLFARADDVPGAGSRSAFAPFQPRAEMPPGCGAGVLPAPPLRPAHPSVNTPLAVTCLKQQHLETTISVQEQA